MISAMVRACLKRQPRGAFTVAGDPERYKDGRRDLRVSLEERFIDSVKVIDDLVFSYSSNGYPDLEVLVKLMRSFKRRAAVHERGHPYRFGTDAQATGRGAPVCERQVIGE